MSVSSTIKKIVKRIVWYAPHGAQVTEIKPIKLVLGKWLSHHTWRIIHSTHLHQLDLASFFFKYKEEVSDINVFRTRTIILILYKMNHPLTFWNSSIVCCTIERPFNNWSKYNPPLVASTIDVNSVSVVDKATIDCSFDLYEIKPMPSV